MLSFLSVLLVAAEAAQASEAKSPVGIVKSPCSVLPTGEAERLLLDFGQLCRYEKANASLPPPTDHRVVLIGDSITDFWMTDDPQFFTNDILCRGIAGQTTSQMLLRFRADVLNLQPKAVHILAGTNDIAGNTGPTTLARIQDNIKQMVELAQAHNLQVMLGSLLPAKAYGWRPGLQPSPAIKAMNAWLKDYAEKTGTTFIDYYSAMVDENGGLPKTLSPDGVHPNPAGYAIMRPLLERALAGLRLTKNDDKAKRDPAGKKLPSQHHESGAKK